jgi:LPPG:FO 2-phospho-L-lactate transferase
VKGPAAKMYRELGIEPSALAVAYHYRSLVKGFVIDTIDRNLQGGITELGMRVCVTNSLMKSHEDRSRLAQDLLAFIGNYL